MYRFHKCEEYIWWAHKAFPTESIGDLLSWYLSNINHMCWYGNHPHRDNVKKIMCSLGVVSVFE